MARRSRRARAGREPERLHGFRGDKHSAVPQHLRQHGIAEQLLRRVLAHDLPASGAFAVLVGFDQRDPLRHALLTPTGACWWWRPA